MTRKNLEAMGIPSVTFNWWEFYSFSLNYAYSYRIELYRKEFVKCRKEDTEDEPLMSKLPLGLTIFSFGCMVAFLSAEISFFLKLFSFEVQSVGISAVTLSLSGLFAFVTYKRNPQKIKLFMRKYWLEVLLLWLRLQILPYLSTSFSIIRCSKSISSDGVEVNVVDVAPNIHCFTWAWGVLLFTGVSMIIRVTGSLPTLLLLAEADHERFIEPKPSYEIWFWVYVSAITFISITFPKEIYARLMFTILLLLYDLKWLLLHQPYKKARVVGIKVSLNLVLTWCAISSTLCQFFYNKTGKHNLVFLFVLFGGCFILFPLGGKLNKYIRWVKDDHEKKIATFQMRAGHRTNAASMSSFRIQELEEKEKSRASSCRTTSPLQAEPDAPQLHLSASTYEYGDDIGES